MFISYAQNGEDIVLWRALRHITNGTYVDVGAADPTEFSVTKAFYDRGWSGVNIEPGPEFAEKLQKQRPLDTNLAICAGDTAGTITFHYVPGTGLSTTSADHLSTIADNKFDIVDLEIEVQRLDSILQSSQLSGVDIHFLKVDVEGAEESVLRGIDLSVWRPWVLIIEATEPLSTEQNHDSWHDLLIENGYGFSLFDGLNRFYVAAEHDELRNSLSYPAGVFDQPYTVGVGQHELAARAESLIVERDELQASYSRLESEHQLSLQGYNDLQSRYAEAIASYESLQRTYDESVSSYQLLQRTYDESINSYGALEHEYAGALAGYARLEKIHNQTAESLGEAVTREAEANRSIEDLGRQHQSAVQRLEELQASMSWRMTAPLRSVKRIRKRGN